MTSLAAPLTTPAPTTGTARSYRALWTHLLRRLAGADRHDPSLRAGVERPSAPMLMSISLGGAAHLR
jgi:hypothetical protein